MEMTGDQTTQLREHLLYLLTGGGAHVSFDKAIAGLPPGLRGAKSPGVPHTPWRLLEHLRIAQWDILDPWLQPVAPRGRRAGPTALALTQFTDFPLTFLVTVQRLRAVGSETTASQTERSPP